MSVVGLLTFLYIMTLKLKEKCLLITISIKVQKKSVKNRSILITDNEKTCKNNKKKNQKSKFSKKYMNPLFRK